jgi:hypothetical protein
MVRIPNSLDNRLIDSGKLPATCTGRALHLRNIVISISDTRLCGLLGRIHGYRSRGNGFGSRCYQIFCAAVSLERGPLRLVRITEN